MTDIILEKWSLEDKFRLNALCNSIDRSFLSDRIPYPYTDRDAEAWLSMVSRLDGSEGIFRAIKKDGLLIGNISVEKKADIYRLDGEIGYFLLDEYKGQGIMTEAVSQICELAFSDLDICRITGLVFAENTASARVLEKNGFKSEGCMKQAVIKNGMLHDLLVYGKLKTI